jgi:hypothetical protein
MGDVIKTNSGIGSPGYIDAHAPDGGQWLTGNPPYHTKVPEGTKVEKTGKVNGASPTYFCEIKLLNGPYVEKVVWVKHTHVVTEDEVTDPSVGNRKKYKIISSSENESGRWLELEEVTSFK